MPFQRSDDFLPFFPALFCITCWLLCTDLEYFWPRFDDHFFWDSEVCEEHPRDVPGCVELKVRRSGWWRATARLPVVKVVAVLAIRNDHMISRNLYRNVTVLHPFWAQGTQTKVSTFHSCYKAAFVIFVTHLVESNGGIDRNPFFMVFMAAFKPIILSRQKRHSLRSGESNGMLYVRLKSLVFANIPNLIKKVFLLAPIYQC